MALRILSILCLAAALLQAKASQSPLTISIDPNTALLKISHHQQLLLAYSFHSNNFKPYVKELYTTSGQNVLLDAPADHLHHHGLMYAIRINGINFWEETNTSGHEKHARFLHTSESINSQGKPEATFTELIYWVPPHSAKVPDFDKHALLVEERTLTLQLNSATSEVALHWRSRFEVPRDGINVQLHGSAYNGLGLRFPTNWNHTSIHSNSEKLPYTKEHTWEVTPARWAAVAAPDKAPPGMVSLFSRPENAGESMFFSMNNSFAYLAVTQNLEKKPLQYPPGARFAVNYLLLVHDKLQPAEFLANRYSQWASGGPK